MLNRASLYVYAWALCLTMSRRVRVAAYAVGGVMAGLAVFGLALQAMGYGGAG